MSPRVAAVAIAIVSVAAPAAASAATLSVEPDSRCYREQQTVFLAAEGYTPNGFVDFTRDGQLVERLQADASGAISGNLTLPGLVTGQRALTYVGLDVSDPARRAELPLLASATDVRVKPVNGAPNRLLTITGRGFFGSDRDVVWAHVIRRRQGAGSAARRVRTLRIGRVEGACKRIEARKRLFRRNPAPGRYRVQFDLFRKYRPNRVVQYDGLIVTILSPASVR
jgi:hypothetical protein